MSVVETTRTLLGPADPARYATIAPPRHSAAELIARAPAAAAAPRYRPSRRLVLTAAAATVVAAAGAAVVAREYPRPAPQTGPGAGPAVGTVLVPIAYQYDTGAPPAGPALRALADRIVQAPYERRTGRYTYHDVRVWGDPIEADGPYLMAMAGEQQVWRAADGSGQQRDLTLEPEFPDAASRDYWQRVLRGQLNPPPTTYPLPPADLPPLPTDRAGLADVLEANNGADAMPKFVAMLFAEYAVPLAVRVRILRLLADAPGFVWRGSVTDRAGRPGVAITVDDPPHGEEQLLVFDPATGVLLAQEMLVLKPKRISTYQLILATDRTDKLG